MFSVPPIQTLKEAKACALASLPVLRGILFLREYISKVDDASLQYMDAQAV